MKKVLLNHIKLNLKEYIFVTICLLIGVLVGVIFINSVSDMQKEEISSYITTLTTFIKSEEKINKLNLLIESLKQNLGLIFLIWFFGCTIIGFPIIYIIILYRGFCIGYTISSIVAVYSNLKGLLLIFTSLFIQNLVLIPAILLISVSRNKII